MNVFTLLLQVATILAVSRLMGALAVKVRQPKVVGEMLAGIMLGPSLLGWMAPGVSGWIFPPESIGLLNVLAQLGVILFLFLIGLELDPKLMRGRGHSAVLISHVSIIAPFLLGAALTLYLYPRVFNDGPHMKFSAAALFMGAAMSITAFPVLARILTERGLQKTNLGVVAITCAAVDDVSAWCMLAFVVAVARAEGLVPGLVTAGLAAVYVVVMLLLVRPWLRRLETLYERPGTSRQGVVAIVLLLALVSAAVSEKIGIHALFGAFLMGAIMPKGTRFVQMVVGKLEDLTIVFLLPIFFAYAGLRTQIGLLDSSQMWYLTGLIILVACLGKFGGSTLAAWWTGMSWRESGAIGVLMNTRGLMELVILTIGLQLGVITDAVFAMMVIMALVTTAMTTPILYLVYPPRLFDTAQVDDATAAREYGILVPVSRPESGPGLARLAGLLGRSATQAKVYALHLERQAVAETLAAPVPPPNGTVDVLGPLVHELKRVGMPVEQHSYVSRDVASDIARVARAKRADLVLIGFHKPVIGNTILGGTVHRVVTGVDADVAILVDRGTNGTQSVLVPFAGSQHDVLAVELAGRLAISASSAGGAGVAVTVLVVGQPDPQSSAAMLRVQCQVAPRPFKVVHAEEESPVDAVLRASGQHDLAIVGLSEDWGLASQLFGLRAERIAQEWKGSLLLVRRQEALQGLG